MSQMLTVDESLANVSPTSAGAPLQIPASRFRTMSTLGRDAFMTVKTPTGSPETLLHPDNLMFTMVGADGIRAADDNGRSDPYVIIDILDAASETRSVVKEVADAFTFETDRDKRALWAPPKKHQYRTKTIQATLSPRWNENFELPLRYMIKPFRPIKLRFTAFDKDVVNDDFLGFAELAINSIEDCMKYMMGDYETSLPFGPRPNNQKDELEYYKAKKDFGTMHLRVRMEGCENFHAAVTRSMGMSMHVNKLVVCVVAASRLKTKDTKTRPVVEFDASGNVEKSAHPKGTAHVTQQALRSSKSTDPTWQPNERYTVYLKPEKPEPTTVKMTVRSGPGGKFLGYYELVLDEKMLATMVGQRRLAKLNLRTRGEDHPDHNDDMVLFLDPKNKQDLGELRVSIRASAGGVEAGPTSPVGVVRSAGSASLGGPPEGTASKTEDRERGLMMTGSMSLSENPYQSSKKSAQGSKKDVPIRAGSIPHLQVLPADSPRALQTSQQAEQLYKAMKGWGTDEDSIWAALEGMGGQGQWDGVRESFSKRYPTFHDGDVVAALRDELTAEEMQRAEGILSKNQIGLTGKHPKRESAAPLCPPFLAKKAAEAQARETAEPAGASAAQASQVESLAEHVEKLVSAVQHQQEALQTQQSQHDALLAKQGQHEALLAKQRAQHEAFAEKQLQRQQELLAEQQAALQKQFAAQRAALAEQLHQSQRTFFEQQEQLLSPLRERAGTSGASGSVRSTPPGPAPLARPSPAPRPSNLDRHRPRQIIPPASSASASTASAAASAASEKKAPPSAHSAAASVVSTHTRPGAPASVASTAATHSTLGSPAAPTPSVASAKPCAKPGKPVSSSTHTAAVDPGAAERQRRDDEKKQKRREQVEALDRAILSEVQGLRRAMETQTAVQRETQHLLRSYLDASPQRGSTGRAPGRVH